MLLLLQICIIGVHYLSCPKDDHQKACSIGKDHGFPSLSFNNAHQKADSITLIKAFKISSFLG